uniref:G-protein coupled receptors family 1 profile domain-containing protein n=1 Tax=Strongyloides venezuelensis TaxID=75913 RepID=A0A0K0G0M7_STRVS
MISRNNLLKYIAFAASIFVNLLSFMSFATELFQLDIKWVPDEICTLTKSPTSSIVNQITGSTYYLLLVVPLIVGIINFFMIKHLNSQASTNLNLKFKQTESKIIFINLIIQTIQPFFGHWPSTFFSFYLKSNHDRIDVTTLLSQMYLLTQPSLYKIKDESFKIALDFQSFHVHHHNDES